MDGNLVEKFQSIKNTNQILKNVLEFIKKIISFLSIEMKFKVI